MNPKNQYLGFNSWGNFGVNSRTTTACGVGRLRSAVGSTNRIYNYCSRTSANPLACALNLPTNSPNFTVPSAPTITSVTSGNTQLTVNFTAPTNDGGSSITDYEYSTDNGVSFTSAGVTTSPITITGLTNGTTYNVVIRAINSVGNGDPSNTVSGIPSTVPSAPTITSVTSGNTQLTVNFTAPTNDGGSSITDYEYSTDNGVSFTSAGVTTSPITITGLTNGTTYNVVIRAINSVGNSIASNSISGVPSTVPDPPTGLSATNGNSQATISFTPGSNGGSDITNYKYSLNGGAFIAFSPVDTSSPVTITGLTNGVTYSITLKAINANGESIASSAVSATPTAPGPSAPTSLSSVGGNQAAYILFTQTGTVTNYEYSTDNGVTFLAFSPSQIYSPVEITTLSSDGVTRLTNGITYTVKLKAVNSGALSSESDSVNVTPTITSLTSTGRIIYLDANNSSSYSGSGTTWTNLDSSGAYSATLNGSPTFDTTTDPGNKYFMFNPGAVTGQFAQINQAAAINPVLNQPFTIQMWVKINNIGSQGTIVSKVFGAPSYDGYALGYRTDNTLQLHENGSSRVNYFNSVSGVLSSGWALYTANIQFGNGGGRQNKVFVNGRQVLSATSTETGIPSPTQNLTFPTGFYGEGECDIGQFYYYNTELTTTQIIQNFDATKSTYI